MAYIKTNFINDDDPAINSNNLNKQEEAIRQTTVFKPATCTSDSNYQCDIDYWQTDTNSLIQIFTGKATDNTKLAYLQINSETKRPIVDSNGQNLKGSEIENRNLILMFVNNTFMVYSTSIYDRNNSFENIVVDNIISKNRLKMDKFSFTRVDITNYLTDNNTIVFNGTTTVSNNFFITGGNKETDGIYLPAGTYTFTLEKESGSIVGDDFNFYLRRDNGTTIYNGTNLQSFTINSSVTNGTKISFTYTTTGEKLHWMGYLSDSPRTFSNLRLKFQIESGSIASEVSPYKDYGIPYPTKTVNISDMNLDTLTKNLPLAYGNNCLNRPDGTNGIYLTVIEHSSNSNYCVQIAIDRPKGDMYTRTCENKVWNNWKTAIAKEDIFNGTWSSGTCVLSRPITDFSFILVRPTSTSGTPTICPVYSNSQTALRGATLNPSGDNVSTNSYAFNCNVASDKKTLTWGGFLALSHTGNSNHGNSVIQTVAVITGIR